MAFDKVIDSTALDAGMTATANAIREKTGGTGPIMWDVSNGFKNAVEAIQASGGGTPYATGSFTPAAFNNRPVITHNLNSTKVFVVWTTDENPAVFNSRYRAVMGFCVSNGVFPELTMDTSAYNSNTGAATEVPTGPDDTALMTSVAHGSPYKGYSILERSYVHVANTDPNTFTLHGYESFETGHLYKWIAVDISGVLPWAEEG